ncbi:MAG: methionine adenosyltransferase [Clostridiales bacterium]|nr:methionine adenosyltransferase [Clostridiales bacterium]MBS6942239.1 methionine adenosyltransferase [Clostridiales bacterium]
MDRRYFTSESVTEGHPDKLCDQVSDAVVDEILRHDPAARVACECTASTGLLNIFGEITTSCYVDLQKVARDTVRDIGYTRGKYGFDADTCAVVVSIDEQSPDIAMGVDSALETRAQGGLDIGAGDQGLMFGFACNQTEQFMPLPIELAHALTRRMSQARKSGEVPYMRPDGKSQVTVEYVDGVPTRVDTVVISTQHDPEATHAQIEKDMMEKVIAKVIPQRLLDDETKYYINPTGRFVIGGPHGDAGLTGRKIIVDTYGGYARHGGGAFSGKDPTKVDRSASYAARYAAKNIVAAGLAEECELQLAYAIGVAHPVSVRIDTRGTAKAKETDIENALCQVMDFRPQAIIERLGLRRPLYRQIAAYGHFGRPDLDLPWEKLDLMEDLKKKL